MRAGSYISLARNYSFVIIILVLITFQGTQTYIGDLSRVSVARKLFIDLIMNRFLEKMPSSADGIFSCDGVALKYQVSARGQVRFFVDTAGHWASDLRYVSKRRINSWEKSENDDDNMPATSDSANDDQKTLAELRDLYLKVFGKAADVQSGLSPIAEAAVIVPKIESNALQRQTAVPGLGLEFRNGIAPWFIALAVLGLLIQIRNQVRRAALDPDAGLDEPWLILDGRRGSEKVAAGVWVVVILLSPWVATGCLIAITAAESIADGWAAGLLQETLFHLCLASLLVLGGWTSLTSIGEILKLRHLRLARLRNTSPP